MTIIIYLIGKPGTGKYTIAKEIAQHGYVICDNQLVNNPIFSLLNYDGLMPIPSPAWDAIKRIRDAVFDFITIEPNNNYVLTNVLDATEGDRQLFEQVKEMALKRNSLFVPVKLYISEHEHLKRIQSVERRLRYKSVDINYVLHPEHPLMQVSHQNLMELDVSDLSAESACRYPHVSKKILIG